MSTKPDTETDRHPLAVAWDEWLASDEGQQARAANTLPHNTDYYLENRLHRAFDAGAKAVTISPSDFEQLIRLREAARDAMKWMSWWVESEGTDLPDGLPSTPEILAALREALAQRPTGGQS